MIRAFAALMEQAFSAVGEAVVEALAAIDDVFHG